MKKAVLYISFFLVFILSSIGGYFFGMKQANAPITTLEDDKESAVMNIAVVENTPSPLFQNKVKTGYLIRELEKHIALFEVYSDNSTILINFTDTLVERLRNEDIELIREGIFIKDYEEAQKTLENFLN